MGAKLLHACLMSCVTCRMPYVTCCRSQVVGHMPPCRMPHAVFRCRYAAMPLCRYAACHHVAMPLCPMLHVACACGMPRVACRHVACTMPHAACRMPYDTHIARCA